MPCLKCKKGRKLNLVKEPTNDESHFKNYNVEELELHDISFFRSDFIVKFINMNREKFHSLILNRVQFPGEHIQDLAKYLKE